jgi:hypothetical protein
MKKMIMKKKTIWTYWHRVINHTMNTMSLKTKTSSVIKTTLETSMKWQ